MYWDTHVLLPCCTLSWFDLCMSVFQLQPLTIYFSDPLTNIFINVPEDTLKGIWKDAVCLYHQNEVFLFASLPHSLPSSLCLVCLPTVPATAYPGGDDLGH